MLIQTALKADVLLRYANPKKKALSSPLANGKNVMILINTTSHAYVLMAGASGAERDENKKNRR